MTSNQPQNFKAAKKKVRRQRILKIIFAKLFFLSLFQKLLKLVLKYFFLTSIAAIIGWKAGTINSEEGYQFPIPHQKEIIQLRKDQEETQSLLATKIDYISRLEKELDQSFQKQKLSADSLEQTIEKLSNSEIEQRKLRELIQKLELNKQELQNDLKQTRSTLEESERESRQTKHQFELENLKVRKDLELVNHQLVTKEEQLSLLQERFNQNISSMDDLTNELKNLNQELERLKLEKTKLQSSFTVFHQIFESNRQNFDEKVASLKKVNDSLELQIVCQEDQIRLKELKIEELRTQLQTQAQLFQDELTKIRGEVKNLSTKIESFEAQKRLDWILRSMDKLLLPKLKIF